MIVYARWKGDEPMQDFTRTLSGRMHRYEVPIKPTAPLQVGQRVRILALSRVAFHAPSVVYPRYETYDPHIVGVVVAVVEKGEHAVTFEVANQCEANPVRRVKLTIQWIPDVTARVRPEDEHVNWPQPVHRVPLEHGVAIAVPTPQWICGAPGCVVPTQATWSGIIWAE